MNRAAFFVVLSSLFLGSCSLSHRPDCSAPPLSRAQIVEIVKAEIEKRGGDPSSVARSRVKITRDVCDYIYSQVYRPKRPGGYLFVRIDEAGQIVDWHPGL